MIYKEAESVLFKGKSKRTLGTYKFSDYGISKEEAVVVWYAFRYDSPTFFMTSNAYASDDKEMTVKIARQFSKKSVREKVKNAIDKSVEEVRKLLDGVNDDILKIKLIYDYVIDNTEYSGQLDGYSYSMA